MKQLLSLFLFLLPCLAWAQYPSNGNQKITLGEQTSADGLIWRGVAATDTVRKPSIDTMAYMVLDTTTNIMWHYKKATSNAWLRLNLLPSDTASIAYVNTYGTQTVSGAKTFSSALTATRFNPTANTATGTGMFLPATNSLGFSTAGTNKMTIDASGYIGINSTTVDGNNLKILSNANGFCLDLDKTAGFGAVMQMRNTSPVSTGLFRVINAAGSVISEYTPTANGLNFSIGNVGIASATTSARLHLGFSTENSGTAPLKFTSGVLNTTPEVGAMEFVSTNLYFTPNSGVRHTVNHGLPGSATLNFPSTLTMLSADLTITVTGAADGDVVSLGVPNAAVNANTFYSAWVSAANTVTVRFNNYSIGTVDPASALFKVFVTK
jgi:hypothetical protein